MMGPGGSALVSASRHRVLHLVPDSESAFMSVYGLNVALNAEPGLILRDEKYIA